MIHCCFHFLSSKLLQRILIMWSMDFIFLLNLSHRLFYYVFWFTGTRYLWFALFCYTLFLLLLGELLALMNLWFNSFRKKKLFSSYVFGHLSLSLVINFGVKVSDQPAFLCAASRRVYRNCIKLGKFSKAHSCSYKQV